jgi:hypothetical protein
VKAPDARRGIAGGTVRVEPFAKQLDAVAAIGDLDRFDWFVAPAQMWDLGGSAP